MIHGFNQNYNRLTSWFMRQVPSRGVRRVVALSAAVASETGSARQENQDRVAIARGRDFEGNSFILAALSDGIGGMQCGAECASATLGSFFGTFFEESQSKGEPELWLSQAALKSNSTVNSMMDGVGGATLVAALISSDDSAYWLSVGDSRVHSSQGTKLSQISVDDTIAGQLGKQIDSGIGMGNLLQYIGMGKELEPHVSRLDASQQGSVLLTSDGIHFLDPSWIGLIAGNSSDPGHCVHRLSELAKWCGGSDDASAAMITLDPVINAPMDTLEIWDPFGELQIITDIERIAPITTKGSGANSPIPDDLVNSPVHSDKPSSTEESKTKKKRATRKRKKAVPKGKKKRDKDEVLSDAPQLLVEFSKKKT